MTWLDDCVSLLNDDTTQGCEAGHETHARSLTNVTMPYTHNVGAMQIFDAARYRDTEGYCPGDDDVSRTLAVGGVWERAESEAFMKCLARSNAPVVIDFGSHIGWYTMMAAAHNFKVLAIEGVAEHEELTRHNVASLGVPDRRLWQAHHWVGLATPYLPAEDAPRIACVKIDLEGKEEDAVRSLFELLRADLIDNILLEVSPVFCEGYEDLLRRLMHAHGFCAATVSPWQSFDLLDIEAVVNEQPQIDVILSRNPYWL